MDTGPSSLTSQSEPIPYKRAGPSLSLLHLDGARRVGDNYFWECWLSWVADAHSHCVPEMV